MEIIISFFFCILSVYCLLFISVLMKRVRYFLAIVYWSITSDTFYNFYDKNCTFSFFKVQSNNRSNITSLILSN